MIEPATLPFVSDGLWAGRRWLRCNCGGSAGWFERTKGVCGRARDAKEGTDKQ